MIRHTLFMRFGAGTPPPERDAIFQALIALCDRVAEVSSFTSGPTVGVTARAEGFTHAFAVDFRDEEARDAFRAQTDYALALERLSEAAEAVQVSD